jgi:TIR domain
MAENEVRDVFISYSHRDRESALRLHALLERLGLTVWRDQTRLVAGNNFIFTIHAGIANARRVIVLWSRAAVQSEYVIAEAEFARSNRKLVPLEIDPCVPSVRILHRLKLSIAEADPKTLTRALGALDETGAPLRVFSLGDDDIRIEGASAANLYGHLVRSRQRDSPAL